MDAKEEREKLIEAARKFANKPDTKTVLFAVDFHLAESRKLRQQLAEANEIIAQYGYKSQWRCGGEGVSRKVEG